MMTDLTEILDEAYVIDRENLKKCLDYIKETGQILHSAQRAGIPVDVWNGLYKESVTLQERVALAVQMYGEQLQEKARVLCLHGQERLVLGGRNRDEPFYENIIPVQLLIAELQRTLPEQYGKAAGNKQQAVLTDESKVIVVPAAMTTEQWIEAQEEKNRSKKNTTVDV